jgi:hypothetical protein
MEPGWLVVLLSCCVATALGLRRTAVRLVGHGPERTPLGGLRRRAIPTPATRPIELLARDARRLGSRYHHPARGVAFAKVEGIRQAYDKVLAECCQALEVEHLLLTLPPGVELDNERRRVEQLLARAGLHLDVA